MVSFLFMAKEKQELNTAIVEEIVQENVSPADLAILKEMVEKGVMYGHKKTRTHPRFKPFIFTTRNGVEIIDLDKTRQYIEKAAEFLTKILAEKKTILLVGTQPASWEAIEKLSNKFNMPLIKNRWIGGLITNFKVIYQRLEYYRKIKSEMERGEFEKYTKKERVEISKKIAKLGILFNGLDKFTKLPDVILMVDPTVKHHNTALLEAKIAKIPVIAIIDSDGDPERVDYPIPANDHAKMSIEWIVDQLISLVKIAPEESATLK